MHHFFSHVESSGLCLSRTRASPGVCLPTVDVEYGLSSSLLQCNSYRGQSMWNWNCPPFYFIDKTLDISIKYGLPNWKCPLFSFQRSGDLTLTYLVMRNADVNCACDAWSSQPEQELIENQNRNLRSRGQSWLRRAERLKEHLHPSPKGRRVSV